MYVCVCSVTQSCLTFCDPMDCSPPGSSVHGIFLARILEQVTISYFRGSSQHRNQTHVCCISCLSRRILYHCTTWEALFRCMCVEKCLEGCMPHDSWGCKESDMTERLNWTELKSSESMNSDSSSMEVTK